MGPIILFLANRLCGDRKPVTYYASDPVTLPATYSVGLQSAWAALIDRLDGGDAIGRDELLRWIEIFAAHELGDAVESDDVLLRSVLTDGFTNVTERLETLCDTISTFNLSICKRLPSVH